MTRKPSRPPLEPKKRTTQIGETSPRKPQAKKIPFTQVREQALRSIDDLPWEQAKPLIEQFYKRSGTPLPPTDNALLTAVHQQRVTLEDVYPVMAKVSRDWLATQGYDGGK